MTREDIMAKGFFNDNRFLSNFHPCLIKYENLEYPSAEHLYVALKTTDESIREAIAGIPAAKDVKAFGMTIKLRPNWNDIRLSMMYIVVSEKFQQNKDLAEKLIATGDNELVEHNWWNDKYWGKHFGEGENHLGRTLMEVREELNEAIR